MNVAVLQLSFTTALQGVVTAALIQTQKSFIKRDINVRFPY